MDVTYNLRSFYSKLGFRVFFSRSLHDADLLVVTRPLDKVVNTRGFRFSLVHVFDYTGWSFDRFVHSFDYSITYIFCTSDAGRERLVNKLGFPGDHAFIALPPVDVSLWCRRLRRIKYKLVHIGNFKHLTSPDEYQERFIKAIRQMNINLWGLGWKDFGNRLYNGRVGLFGVSRVYSESEYSLGLMYPFQRDVTYSGRFWHAPLNGCCLLSEPGYYTKLIPGIVETDYSAPDIKGKIQLITDREKIQQDSSRFWKAEYYKTQTLVLNTLKEFNTVYFSWRRLAVFGYMSFLNTLMRIWQQAGISALLRH
jgi:hypothetical protein